MNLLFLHPYHFFSSGLPRRLVCCWKRAVFSFDSRWKRKDLSSSVHFHVSSFVHVTFALTCIYKSSTPIPSVWMMPWSITARHSQRHTCHKSLLLKSIRTREDFGWSVFGKHGEICRLLFGYNWQLNKKLWIIVQKQALKNFNVKAVSLIIGED